MRDLEDAPAPGGTRAHARAVRPRRLQELQRRLRPPGRRLAARAPRRASSTTASRGQRRAPTASAATSSASCSTASATSASALLAPLRRRAHRAAATASTSLLARRRPSCPSEADERADALRARRPAHVRREVRAPPRRPAARPCDVLLQRAARARARPAATTSATSPSSRCASATRLGLDSDGARRRPPGRRAARRRQVRGPGRDPRQARPARRAEWEFVRQPHAGRRAHPARRARARTASPSSSARATSASTAPATPTASSAETIPLGARIIAACDAWDAMITDPPVPPRALHRRRAAGAAPLQRARSSTRSWCGRCARRSTPRRTWLRPPRRSGANVNGGMGRRRVRPLGDQAGTLCGCYEGTKGDPN